MVASSVTLRMVSPEPMVKVDAEGLASKLRLLIVPLIKISVLNSRYLAAVVAARMLEEVVGCRL